MKNNFQPKQGDVKSLTHDERATLETKVIPTADRWMREYKAGTTLHEQGKKTLEYWGRLSGHAHGAA